MKVYLLNRADVRVFCDGKLLPICREAGTEYIQTDKADGETVVLRLVRKHELSRPLWALYALLFWIVGIMGFFTPRYSKFPHSLDCSVSFAENKNAVLRLRFSHFLDETGTRNAPAVSVIEGSAQLENFLYTADNTARKRRRIYTACSWIARIILIAAIVAAAIYLIVER